MNSDVKKHYDSHLAFYYSWMLGGFDEKVNEFRRFFKDHDITPHSTKSALDLGAGNGLQSIPLAEAGFEVLAIDFSSQLLAELKSRSGGFNIKTLESDIMQFDAYSPLQPELIVCMGDTLTHLESPANVESLIRHCASLLTPSGRMVVSFRDLNFELKGVDRFIPVQSSDDRIFTCFLEYGLDRVQVSDIVHEKENGKWYQKISNYSKLKLSKDLVTRYFQNAGCSIEFEDTVRGFVTMIARKAVVDK